MIQDKIRDRNDVEIEKVVISDRESWLSRTLKFIFIPKYRLKQLNPELFDQINFKKKRQYRNWLKSPLTIIGIVIVFVIINFAIFDSWFAPYSYEETRYSFFENPYSPPSSQHLLGTGFSGEDILSKIIYGTRYSLLIAISAVGISLVLGILLGIFSGYYGGWIDAIMMRIIDIILAFPGLIFAMAILAIWGSSIEKMILILGIIGTPYFARLMRMSVMRIKEMEYVSAARVVGANNRRIMFRHILPNSFDPILISISFDIGRLIINIAILSFLGFGDFRFILWGDQLFHAAENMWIAPWASLWPCVMILISVLGFMLLGDGLRDALDPRYQYKTI
ncbi:MAG: ABC transporter permease [Promethearchaeota archaeon]